MMRKKSWSEKMKKTPGNSSFVYDISKIYEKTGCQSWRPVCVCIYYMRNTGGKERG